VAAAAAELAAQGHHLTHGVRTEWGQITAGLLSPDALLAAVCYSPAFHDG
jgi:hypothetical protein